MPAFFLHEWQSIHVCICIHGRAPLMLHGLLLLFSRVSKVYLCWLCHKARRRGASKAKKNRKTKSPTLDQSQSCLGLRCFVRGLHAANQTWVIFTQRIQSDVYVCVYIHLLWDTTFTLAHHTGLLFVATAVHMYVMYSNVHVYIYIYIYNTCDEHLATKRCMVTRTHMNVHYAEKHSLHP